MSALAKPLPAIPVILILWNQGKDTADIAKALRLPESVVANELARLRDLERQP